MTTGVMKSPTDRQRGQTHATLQTGPSPRPPRQAPQGRELPAGVSRVDVGPGRRGAAIRDMLHLDVCKLIKQHSGHMARRSVALRRKCQFARMGLGVSNELMRQHLRTMMRYFL